MNTGVPWLPGEMFATFGVDTHGLCGDYPIAFIPDRIRILVSDRCADPPAKAREIAGLLRETMRRVLSDVCDRHASVCKELDIRPCYLPGAPAVPWDIIERPEGGIGIRAAEQWDGGRIIPCWLYASHAVLADDSGVRIVAGRLPGRPMDPHDDILHECLHAALAPVPAFVQSYQLDDAKRAIYASSDAEDMGQDAICGLVGYAIPEIVVAHLAGEQRDTETRFPVVETPRMLELFLRLAQDIAPGYGFSFASEALRAEGLSEMTRAYLVGACMKVLARYRGTFLTGPTPTPEDFRIALA